MENQKDQQFNQLNTETPIQNDVSGIQMNEIKVETKPEIVVGAKTQYPKVCESQPQNGGAPNMMVFPGIVWTPID